MTRPDPVDKHVGTRLRMRRLMLKMSQSALAETARITFQQVQKYEKGTNRISSSRLQQFANVLDVPIAYFFEDQPTNSKAVKASDHDMHAACGFSDFMATKDGLALVNAFQRIKSRDLRRSVVYPVEPPSNQGWC
jgi:transcriptional regulator with XRE-family HTH domain